MNSPFLRTKALVQAKELLAALADPSGVLGVPADVQAQARALLEHYPTLFDIQKLHEASPDLLGPPPPFSRLAGGLQTSGAIDATKGDGHE
ncbi:MAG: BPSL0761 family protein [Hylemonella sp.]